MPDEHLLAAPAALSRGGEPEFPTYSEGTERATSGDRFEHERYRLLVETAHEGILIAQDEKLRFVNPRTVEIMGWQREDLLETAFTEFIHPEDREMVLQRYFRRLRGEHLPSRYPFRLLDSNGNTKWVEIESARTTWEGRPAALVFLTDITERKRMEDELKEHREALEKMVEQRTLELTRANDRLMRDISERRRAEQALAQSEQQLRFLSEQLLEAQEKERQRVARELHDGIGQALTAIKLRLENTVTLMTDAHDRLHAASLQAVIPLIQDAVEEVRRISMALRPSMLDDLGILATIGWFCREFQITCSRIRIEKQIQVSEDEVPENVKTVIFRILQEALNNAMKHSTADTVVVRLTVSEDKLELEIRDNGPGFRIETPILSPAGGLGLSSMRERTELSGGTFRICSASPGGTMIRASWPRG